MSQNTVFIQMQKLEQKRKKHKITDQEQTLLNQYYVCYDKKGKFDKENCLDPAVILAMNALLKSSENNQKYEYKKLTVCSIQ